jgi:hypothetical protein
LPHQISVLLGEEGKIGLSPNGLAGRGVNEQEAFDDVLLDKGLGNDLACICGRDVAIQDIERFEDQERFLLAEPMTACDPQVDFIAQSSVVDMLL